MGRTRSAERAMVVGLGEREAALESRIVHMGGTILQSLNVICHSH